MRKFRPGFNMAQTHSFVVPGPTGAPCARARPRRPLGGHCPELVLGVLGGRPALPSLFSTAPLSSAAALRPI